MSMNVQPSMFTSALSMTSSAPFDALLAGAALMMETLLQSTRLEAWRISILLNPLDTLRQSCTYTVTLASRKSTALV